MSVRPRGASEDGHDPCPSTTTSTFAPAMSGTFTLDGRLTAEAGIAAGAEVVLDRAALEAVAANRAVLDGLTAAGTPIYGVTTGFRVLVNSDVRPELNRQLQVNLLRSHAAGTGADLPRAVVRATIVIRLGSLLRAHSGIRPIVLERIAELLNAGLVPCVPQTGSLRQRRSRAVRPRIPAAARRRRDGRLRRSSAAWPRGARTARPLTAGAGEQGGPRARQRRALRCARSRTRSAPTRSRRPTSRRTTSAWV